MTRCQHCKKLTHSEHLDVFFDIKDLEKVMEFQDMAAWKAKYLYTDSIRIENQNEYGELKVGDIYIHFIALEEKK